MKRPELHKKQRSSDTQYGAGGANRLPKIGVDSAAIANPSNLLS
jgi:hypothetical protein